MHAGNEPDVAPAEVFGISCPVARHHTGALHNSPWPSVDALYLANGLIEEIEAAGRPDAPPPLELDLEYLEASGYANQLDRWREEAVRVTEE